MFPFRRDSMRIDGVWKSFEKVSRRTHYSRGAYAEEHGPDEFRIKADVLVDYNPFIAYPVLQRVHHGYHRRHEQEQVADYRDDRYVVQVSHHVHHEEEGEQYQHDVFVIDPLEIVEFLHDPRYEHHVNRAHPYVTHYYRAVHQASGTETQYIN